MQRCAIDLDLSPAVAHQLGECQIRTCGMITRPGMTSPVATLIEWHTGFFTSEARGCGDSASDDGGLKWRSRSKAPHGTRFQSMVLTGALAMQTGL